MAGTYPARPRAADVDMRPLPARFQDAALFVQPLLPVALPRLSPAELRRRRCAVVSRLASRLNDWTRDHSPRGRPGAPVELAAWRAAVPPGEWAAGEAAQACAVYGCPRGIVRAAVRRIVRQHAKRVLSGRWRRDFAAVQRVRAYQRTLPRLLACAPRDRRIVRSRRRGVSWSRIAERERVTVRTCHLAAPRLARLADLRAGAPGAVGCETSQPSGSGSDPIHLYSLKRSTTAAGRTTRARRAAMERPAAGHRRPATLPQEAATDTPRTTARRAGYRRGLSGRPAPRHAPRSAFEVARRVAFRLLCIEPPLGSDALLSALDAELQPRGLVLDDGALVRASRSALHLWRRRYPDRDVQRAAARGRAILAALPDHARWWDEPESAG